jgi:replication factor A1
VNKNLKTESYIKKIIEETGLSKQEIQEKVNNKKEELKGLISDEGALFVIAKELGVDVKEENKELLKDIDINIADLTLNMKNIVVAGRVKEIYAVRSFNREGRETGYVGNFLLHDQTGDIRITLWDEHVKIFQNENFDINELVKIVNGTPKSGRFGGMEIHIGRFSNIILSPEDIDYKLYPKIEFKLSKIKEINLNLKSISIEGKIIQKSPIREFTRKDGGEGKVGSLTILDSTGSIRVTFWNEDTVKIKDSNIDEIVSITNLNPRLSSLDSKTIDLNVTRGSMIKKIAKKIKIETDLIENIKLLQTQSGVVSFKGVITSIENLKRINLKSGKDTSLLGFVVNDETGGIRVTLWGENAEEYASKLTNGIGVLLKNVLIKYSNFSGTNEISLINDSTLEVVNIEIKNLKEIETRKKERISNFTGDYRKIESIKSSEVFEIRGYIAKEITKITIYEACSVCNRKIDNCRCNKKGESENRMILNLTIDDGSSTIRATFFGEKAEKLIGEDTDLIVKLQETPDFERFLENKSKELLGKDIIIKGRTKFSDFSNSYDISVFEFTEVDVNKELDRVMKEIET